MPSPYFHPVRVSCVIALLTLTVLLGTPSRATAQESDSGQLEQIFPQGAPYETRWRLEWEAVSRTEEPDECFPPAQLQEGLRIRVAEFKPSPLEPYVRVLSDARLAEVFVAYHAGVPRFHDIGAFNYPLMELSAADVGPTGALLGARRWVAKELRDRGVAWKDDDRGGEPQELQVVRGQELYLWAALNAGNYIYLIEFYFRDDGSLAFQLGATGHNLEEGEEHVHMHDALWRLAGC